MARLQHLLVIDDEPIHRESLSELLLADGYEVTTSDCARDALGRIDSGDRFDLAICDVMLPGFDGIRFATKLKERSPPIPVVLVTAHTEAVERILASGLVALLKPYSITTLNSVIRDHLPRAGRAA